MHTAKWVAAHPVRLGALVQILLTDGARVELPALMPRKVGQVHARVALHAVAGIQAQPLPLTAEVAVRAVVDLVGVVIVPQVTDAAIACANTSMVGAQPCEPS
jgi:hypothetical protein